MNYNMGEFDVAVVGAGHAGVEASLAAARLGCKTVMFTISLDQIANMPCNPSIGGTAKGHLVREIDALGGEMGKGADKCFIQSRMLNRGKGPAFYYITLCEKCQTLIRLQIAKKASPQQHISKKRARL